VTAVTDEEPVFDVCVEGVTRAYVETVESGLQENGFKVLGLLNGYESYIYSDVFYTAGSYRLQSIACWPASGFIDFYAVYPRMDIRSDFASSDITYTSDDETDLVVSRKTYARMGDGPVVLTFKHALSLLSFTVRGSESNVSYKVRGISVSVPAGGTYTFSSGVWEVTGSRAVTLFTSAGEDVGTDYSALGRTVTAVPGSCTVTVDWDSYQMDQCISHCSYSTTLVLEKGKHNIVRTSLDSHGRQVSMAVDVEAWGTAYVDHRL